MKEKGSQGWLDDRKKEEMMVAGNKGERGGGWKVPLSCRTLSSQWEAILGFWGLKGSEEAGWDVEHNPAQEKVPAAWNPKIQT